MNCALSKAREKGVARFLPNPEECWGPKPRAGRRITSKHTPSHGDMKLNGTHSPKVVDGDNTSMDCEKETEKMMESDVENEANADIEHDPHVGRETETKRRKVDSTVMS